MNHEKVTILCIDDDEQICFALKALFQMQHWNAITAHSVDSGLTAFRTSQPDIVLIDYHMPGVNGVEGVRMLRRLSPTVPIIVFTIEERQEVADAFLEAGASDFALKPIKAPDIVSRIKLHLRLLDRAKARSNVSENLAPVKGISRSTMELILDFFSGQKEYVTMNDIAVGTGLAYQTVYRYLQYMTQEKLIEVLNVYGKVGRPKQVYRRI